MIESIAKLAFMYVITRMFIEFAFPAGKHLLKYIYWSAIFLAIYITVAPMATRFFDDIHSFATTYSEGKSTIDSVLGGEDNASPGVGYLGPWERISGNVEWDIPVKGKVTQSYKGEDHHGIDIGAKEGKEIIVARAGRVEKVVSDPVYGLMVLVSHGGGYESLYAHCSKVMVKERDNVLKGDEIALVGSTGRSTGPHLHFEIRLNGVAKNPMQFLKEEGL